MLMIQMWKTSKIRIMVLTIGSHLGGSPQNWGGAPPNFVDLLA